MNRRIRGFDNSNPTGGVRRGAIAASTALAVSLLLSGSPASAQKCEAGKNQASGKYAACVANAEKGLVLKGDVAKHGAALAKCSDKLGAGFAKLEAKGAVRRRVTRGPWRASWTSARRRLRSH